MISSNKELFQKLRKTDVITENFRIKKAKVRPGFYLKPINKVFRCKYIYVSYKGIYLSNVSNNYLYASEVSTDWKIIWWKTTSDELIGDISKRLSALP